VPAAIGQVPPAAIIRQRWSYSSLQLPNSPTNYMHHYQILLKVTAVKVSPFVSSGKSLFKIKLIYLSELNVSIKNRVNYSVIL
jgi:hypothetical protein